MVQWGKVPATKPKDLGLIPGTYMVEASCLCIPCVHHGKLLHKHMHAHIYTHTNNIIRILTKKIQINRYGNHTYK